jgi:hypothetical protein
VTIVEASDNTTGYDTPRKAIEGMSDEGGDKAGMGFVTVISTSSFVPGTTSLSDSGVTATFTDGFKSTRNTPDACLIYNQQLYVRQKSNDTSELTAPYTKQPTALSSDSDVPLSVRWGLAIVYGTAVEIFSEDGSDEELVKYGLIWQTHLDKINEKSEKQDNVTRVLKASI